jgi:hypothetical protein
VTAEPGPTEIRAQELAQALEAQSLLSHYQAEARAKAARATGGGTAVTVQRPDDPPTVEDQRRWALQLAIQNGYDVIRPDGTPREAYAVLTPEGAAVVKSERPVMIAWGAETADRAEAEWQQLVRDRENAVLIAAYGEKTCRQAGIL